MSEKIDLLVCAATLMELRTFWPDGSPLETHIESDGYVADGETAYLLTGVGIPCALGRAIAYATHAQPERILNIGIAGAYPDSGLKIGSVIAGESEVYGDVGFELPMTPGFRPVRESPFGGEFYGQPLPLEVVRAWTDGLFVGRGCTVNACTGTAATGRLRQNLFGAAFETMEGAAIAQAGWQQGIPVGEIRAISNVAAQRDMRPENIRYALACLRDHFRTIRENSHA